MISLVINITWDGNNVCVYTCILLFYLHNYSNVYDNIYTIEDQRSSSDDEAKVQQNMESFINVFPQFEVSAPVAYLKLCHLVAVAQENTTIKDCTNLF